MTTIAYNATTGKKYLTSGGKIATGDCAVECTHCSDPSQTPAEVVVTIEGVINLIPAGCADCVGVNGEFVLTQQPGGCVWQLNTGISFCGGTLWLQLELTTFLTFTIYDGVPGAGGSPRVFYTTSATGFDDCHLWSSFPVTFGFNSGCEGAGSTVLINTLQQAVYYYPAEAAGGHRDFHSALWAWEIMDGVGTPLHPRRRQSRRVKSRSKGVGDFLAERIKAIIGEREGGCNCVAIQRQMNRVGPEAILKDVDVWAERVANSAAKMFRALSLLKPLAKWELRNMIRRACEDAIKWRSA